MHGYCQIHSTATPCVIFICGKPIFCSSTTKFRTHPFKLCSTALSPFSRARFFLCPANPPMKYSSPSSITWLLPFAKLAVWKESSSCNLMWSWNWTLIWMKFLKDSSNYLNFGGAITDWDIVPHAIGDISIGDKFNLQQSSNNEFFMREQHFHNN